MAMPLGRSILFKYFNFQACTERALSVHCPRTVHLTTLKQAGLKISFGSYKWRDYVEHVCKLPSESREASIQINSKRKLTTSSRMTNSMDFFAVSHCFQIARAIGGLT